MRINNLCKKSISELKKEIINMLREQLNIRMQISSGQINKTHILRYIRRNIARIKTLISQKRKIE